VNLPNLPLWGIGAGLIALAAGLFVLQMLRVRHRQLEVPTTMFWREAVEESRARVLRHRFRHPWAYVLLLSIASLLWLAIAGLTSDSDDDRDYLLILDGSVGMTHPGAFDQAVGNLISDAEGLPANSREVWWSGAQTQLLLARGEHVLLLAERLIGKTPDRTSSALTGRVMNLAEFDSGRPLQVRVYGDAPLPIPALELLPESIEVVRCSPLAEARPGNAGFVAGGVAAAASGNWDRIDLFLDIVGTTAAPVLSTDGASLELVGIPTPTASGTTWRFLDVPARGQLIDVSIASDDGYPADDNLILALPQRRPLQVLISPSLVAMFEPLVNADTAFIVAGDSPDLVIRNQGENLGIGLPALEMASSPASGNAFEVIAAEGEDADQLLREVHEELGLAEIDALSLAQQLQQPISLGVAFDTQRSVQMWDRLLNPEGGFITSRSFPLFMGRSLRWLANAPRVPAFVPTLEPLAGTSGEWRTPAGTSAVTASLPLRASEAGLFTNSGGRILAANAFDANASSALAAAADAPAGTPLSSPSLPLWSWLVLLVIVLLGAEWLLFQNGRIP